MSRASAILLFAATAAWVVGATSAATAPESGGIMQCIDSAIVDGKLRLTHVTEVHGDVVSRDEWVIRCTGPTALLAWDQFFLFRRLDPVAETGPDGGRALLLSIGAGSRCIKLIANADGSAANKAVCDISLDLIPEIQGSGSLAPAR